MLPFMISGATAQSASGCADVTSQTGMSICSAAQASQADGAMSAIYNQVRKRLGPKSPEGLRLRDAQRAWISYRDAWCSFQTMSVEGGSMHPQVYAGCIEKLTKEQTAKLTYLLTCSDDVDCPGSL